MGQLLGFRGTPGWESQGPSQHSQIQPDLLQGHELPCLLVLGLIHHPIGALSDLLYLLEHIHVRRAARETEGSRGLRPSSPVPLGPLQPQWSTCPACAQASQFWRPVPTGLTLLCLPGHPGPGPAPPSTPAHPWEAGLEQDCPSPSPAQSSPAQSSPGPSPQASWPCPARKVPGYGAQEGPNFSGQSPCPCPAWPARWGGRLPRRAA